MRRRDLFGIAALAFMAAAGAAETQATDADLARKLVEATPAIGERSLGKVHAPVTVVEYASATCPHCAAFHNLVWAQFRDAYIDTGKVRWIFREFPLDDLAMAAFMLARCGPEERYFDIIAALFGEQKIWVGGEGDTRAELTRIMAGFGMTKDAFDACVQRQDLVEAIYGIAKSANQIFGVRSTPTFFIDGELVSGAQEYSVFSAKVDAALAKKGN